MSRLILISDLNPSTNFNVSAVEVWNDPDQVDFNFMNINQQGASTAGDKRWRLK